MQVYMLADYPSAATPTYQHGVVYDVDTTTGNAMVSAGAATATIPRQIGGGGLSGRTAGVFASLAALGAVSAAAYARGTTAYVGPDAYGQYAEWFANGARWRPRSGILAMKNTAGSLSDTTTTEQDVYSLVIPAPLIGPNDEIYVEHLWQWPNSATNKTARIKFGGTVISAVTATTSASGRGNSHIYMRDGKAVEIYSNSTSALGWAEGNSSGSAPLTAAVDTNSDVTVSATAQWGTSGAGANLITLERIAIGIKFQF